jgi:phosphatidylglycerol---prolipoprotein diacylglyceryl transferase
MSPILLHLWGPLSIHVYGLFVALGALTGIYCASKDKKIKAIMPNDEFMTFAIFIMIAAVIGGRLLFAIEMFDHLESWIDIFKFWEPGYAILGSIAASLLLSVMYLKTYYGQIFLVLDRIALYAPLAQSIARLGCYFTGCCYGICTTVSWAVVYTDHNNLAPLYTLLHPTQLYSALTLFILFICLQLVQKMFTKPGQLAGLYLMGTALERFFVDFFRADRELTTVMLSPAQIVAICLFVIGLFFLYKDFYAQSNK